MRDPRLVAITRGGALAPAHHQLLALWAADCAERVLPLVADDARAAAAVAAARDWASGACTVGEARAASSAAHAAARAATSTASTYAARAAAVAHMADHELGAAFYAIRALRASGADEARLDDERQWQRRALPDAVAALVTDDIELRAEKFQHDLDLDARGRQQV